MEILKDDTVWKDISKMFQSVLEYQQGEYVSQVDTDLESECWVGMELQEQKEGGMVGRLVRYVEEKFEVQY